LRCIAEAAAGQDVCAGRLDRIDLGSSGPAGIDPPVPDHQQATRIQTAAMARPRFAAR